MLSSSSTSSSSGLDSLNMSSMLLSAAAKTTVSVCVCVCYASRSFCSTFDVQRLLSLWRGVAQCGSATQRGSAQISAQSKDSLTTTATSAAKATLPSLLLRRLAMLVCLLGAYLLCLLCASLLHIGPSSDDFSSRRPFKCL